MTRLLFLLLFSSVTLLAQRTPLRVNGTIVDNPNFVTGATALIGRSGANISVAPTNIANAQITAGAAIDVSKLSGVAPTVHTHAGEDIGSGTVADARLPSAITRDNEWDTTGEINAATTDDDFATLNGTQTLVNKTLTAPVLTTPTLGVATATSLGTDSFPGPGNMTFFDGSQASRTWTFSLSGANDPVITAANNSLSLNVPLTFGDGSAASYVLSSSLSGATDPTITFANNQITGTGHFTSNGNITSGGTLVATTVVQAGASSSFLWAGRSRAFSASDGAVSFRNNADSANAGITAGTLTLTPAAADTTAIAVSGGSTTGSGTTKGGTFSHTLNTSGNVDGAWTFGIVDTASGASTKVLQIFGGASGTTSLFSVDKTGSITSGSVVTSGQLVFTSLGTLRFTSDGVAALSNNGGAGFTSLSLGLNDSSPNNATLKSPGGVGTDIAGGNLTSAAGQSTGTGRGGALIGQTSPSGSTGSSANAYSERYHHAAKAVTLTSATATTVATIACPAAKFVGGECVVTVFASDATDHQARTLRFSFSAINKAATVTAGIDTPDESIAASTGTLTAAITAVANGNAVDIKVNADSSLTETTLSATVSFPSINSNDTAAVTEI